MQFFESYTRNRLIMIGNPEELHLRSGSAGRKTYELGLLT